MASRPAAARVVLTRPREEAAPWRAALTAAGHVVHELPLLEISPLPHGVGARELAAYDASMWVSGGAVRAFLASQPTALFAWPPGLRCWAPGPGTARALWQAGVAPAQTDMPSADAPQFDSEALWPVIESQVQPGRRLLLVRGRSHPPLADEASRDEAGSNGREWLLQRCREAGMVVDTVAAYERRGPVWTPGQSAAARAWAQDGSVWLFSSGEALTHLAQLLPGQDWSRTHALATHPRIAEAARALGFQRLRICRPAPDAVCAALDSDQSAGAPPGPSGMAGAPA